MNNKLHKQNLKLDMRDIKEYLDDLKKEYRAHIRAGHKIMTKYRREFKRLKQKETLYKSL